MIHNAPVVIVPADLSEGAREWVMFEDRITSGWRWTIECARLAGGMGGYGDSGEEIVRLWVGLAEDGSCVEAIDEEGGAAATLGVREEVEKLQSARVGLHTDDV
jgi:hypothetical protein